MCQIVRFGAFEALACGEPSVGRSGVPAKGRGHPAGSALNRAAESVWRNFALQTVGPVAGPGTYRRLAEAGVLENLGMVHGPAFGPGSACHPVCGRFRQELSRGCGRGSARTANTRVPGSGTGRRRSSTTPRSPRECSGRDGTRRPGRACMQNCGCRQCPEPIFEEPTPPGRSSFSAGMVRPAARGHVPVIPRGSRG